MRGCLIFILFISLFACQNNHSENYLLVPRVKANTLSIDGQLNEIFWKNAASITSLQNFFDTSEWHNKTEILLAYDDSYLYLAAQLQNEDIKAEFTQRDSKIYLEHCFEFFIDPGNDQRDYYEFEVNANSAVWDLILKSSDRKVLGRPENIKEWHVPNDYFKVLVDGTLNDSDDTDKAWQFEMCMPWSLIAEGKPKHGDLWKANFMRVDYERNQPQIFAWRTTGTESIHVPEKWGYLKFQ